MNPSCKKATNRNGPFGGPNMASKSTTPPLYSFESPVSSDYSAENY